MAASTIDTTGCDGNAQRPYPETLPIPPRFLGKPYAEELHARWAIFFSVAVIPRQYIFIGDRFPTFWLSRDEAFLCVLGGTPSRSAIQWWANLEKTFEQPILLAVGEPMIAPRLAFASDLDSPTQFCEGVDGEPHWGWLASDRKRDDILWLTSEDSATCRTGYHAARIVTRRALDASGNLVPAHELASEKWPSAVTFEEAYAWSQGHIFGGAFDDPEISKTELV
jgi:hypothetical protein